jgi:hypothetical protein
MPYLTKSFNFNLTSLVPTIDFPLDFEVNKNIIGEVTFSAFSGAASWLKLEFLGIDQPYSLVISTFYTGISTVSALCNFFVVSNCILRVTALVNPVGPDISGGLFTVNLVYAG